MKSSFASRTRFSALGMSFARLVCLMLPLWLLAGCADKEVGDPTRTRPLKAKEIVRLVSRTDFTPLPEVEAVEVLGAGEFREADPYPLPESEVPLCPGQRYRLHRPGRLVRGDLLHGLGMSFVLRGVSPSAESLTERISINRSVPLTMHLEHPPMRDPVTGEVSTSTQMQILGCMDQQSDAVYQFTSDWERVAGPWRMRLVYQGRELARSDFSVVGGREPDAVAAEELLAEAPDLRVWIGKAKRGARQEAVLADRGARAWFVIVSSNIYPENARRDAAALRQRGYPAGLGQYTDPKSGRLWHTVRLGGFGRLREARQAAAQFQKREGRDAWVAVRAVTPEPARTAPEGVVASAPAGSDVRFALQAAAFQGAENARKDSALLKEKGWPASVILKRTDDGRLWHTVRVGWYATRSEAEAEAARFMQGEQRQVLLLQVR